MHRLVHVYCLYSLNSSGMIVDWQQQELHHDAASQPSQPGPSQLKPSRCPRIDHWLPGWVTTTASHAHQQPAETRLVDLSGEMLSFLGFKMRHAIMGGTPI